MRGGNNQEVKDYKLTFTSMSKIASAIKVSVSKKCVEMCTCVKFSKAATDTIQHFYLQ